MIRNSFKNLCLFHILEGLRDGLSRFSGPSRAALIYAEKPDSPVCVYDPQDLLRGHEPKLKEIYLDQDKWRVEAPDPHYITLQGQIYPEKNLELAGLISYGGRTRSIFYQMWFTEHHPDMCSAGPTERWLEQGVFLLSHDFASEDFYQTGSSSYVLREYATHAVRDYIRDELNLLFGWDIKIFVFPILDALLGISKTREEGSWPRGNLVFIEPDTISDLELLVRFPRAEQPDLKNFKHVRKLLQAVEDSDRKLISYGNSIVGIAAGRMPERRSTAEFRGEYGFFSVAGKPVCSFSDGRVYSTTRRPNLVHLEEALLELYVDPSASNYLFRIATAIVHRAGTEGHGCTLVMDFNDPPVEISGQRLEYPLDLRNEHMLELAKSLSRLDGALHMGSDMHLHGFACLLDGHAVQGEDRARGARFNSALRFTAEHENLIVVVVSSDRPVSVIQGGVDLTARCEWKPFSKLVAPPPTLENWIEG
ncbi:MAG: DNA integrity scanning protein DisA nucleotide-binding domain protein [Deltaproteobacteria bacterium]|nr:DNA integrity scanning protein DisA nucleotide-binding domain protein [Deltaproteobacteria bacterium]